MKKAGFVIDSTVYIEDEYIKKYDCEVVQLNVIEGDKTYKEFDLTPEETYAKQDAGAGLTTSQPAPTEFTEAYQRQFDKGAEIVYVFTLSKSLSGTYQSAIIARNEDARKEDIHVFDTGNAAYGNAMLFLEAMKVRESAKSEEDFVKGVQKIIDGSDLLFNVENLFSLQKGGRLSKSQALIGTAMRIKPMIVMEDGKLALGDKTRTYAKLTEKMIERIQKNGDPKKTLVARLINVNSKEQYELMKTKLEEVFPNIEYTETEFLGPVFRVHVGKKGFGVSWYYR